MANERKRAKAGGGVGSVKPMWKPIHPRRGLGRHDRRARGGRRARIDGRARVVAALASMAALVSMAALAPIAAIVVATARRIGAGR